MIIRYKTIVTFELPEEDYLHQTFIENNDLSKWKDTICSNYVSYTRIDTYSFGDELLEEFEDE